MSYPEKCDLCPRMCGADRIVGTGVCGCGERVRIAKVMRHMWEEPCISGTRGSAAVFFCGCALGCVYCQNKEISRGAGGEEYTDDALRELFLSLAASDAHSISLVTPSHFAVPVQHALEAASPTLPVVYNIGGYELPETVQKYMNRADVFLTDFKYGTESAARKYSAAPDYPEVASAALREMYSLVGDPVFSDDGILRRGVILRHLVLPGGRRDSVRALELAADAVPPEKMILSLMRQYTPDFAPRDMHELCRRVTSFEYDYVLDAARDMGYSGYMQDADSASAAYTPDFTRNTGL